MEKPSIQIVLLHGTSAVITPMEEAIRAIDSRISVLHKVFSSPSTVAQMVRELLH